MSQPRFQFIAGSLALDFINTVANRPDPATRRDDLRAIDDVIEWAVAARIEPLLVTNGPPRALRARESDLGRARAARERLYRIFSARAEDRAPSPADLRALNASIRDARSRQHIARTGASFSWVWDASVSPIDRALGTIALDAAALLTSAQPAHIRCCGDERCGWLFLDQSPGGRRRWCSMADCGNRNKARRHYERIAHGGPALQARPRSRG